MVSSRGRLLHAGAHPFGDLVSHATFVVELLVLLYRGECDGDDGLGVAGHEYPVTVFL